MTFNAMFLGARKATPRYDGPVARSRSGARALEQKRRSREEILMNGVLVHTMERYSSFGRSNAVCAATMILGLLVSCGDACAQATALEA